MECGVGGGLARPGQLDGTAAEKPHEELALVVADGADSQAVRGKRSERSVADAVEHDTEVFEGILVVEIAQDLDQDGRGVARGGDHHRTARHGHVVLRTPERPAVAPRGGILRVVPHRHVATVDVAHLEREARDHGIGNEPGLHVALGDRGSEHVHAEADDGLVRVERDEAAGTAVEPVRAVVAVEVPGEHLSVEGDLRIHLDAPGGRAQGGPDGSVRTEFDVASSAVVLTSRHDHDGAAAEVVGRTGDTELARDVAAVGPDEHAACVVRDEALLGVDDRATAGRLVGDKPRRVVQTDEVEVVDALAQHERIVVQDRRPVVTRRQDLEPLGKGATVVRPNAGVVSAHDAVPAANIVAVVAVDELGSGRQLELEAESGQLRGIEEDGVGERGRVGGGGAPEGVEAPYGTQRGPGKVDLRGIDVHAVSEGSTLQDELPLHMQLVGIHRVVVHDGVVAAHPGLGAVDPAVHAVTEDAIELDLGFAIAEVRLGQVRVAEHPEAAVEVLGTSTRGRDGTTDHRRCLELGVVGNAHPAARAHASLVGGLEIAVGRRDRGVHVHPVGVQHRIGRELLEVDARRGTGGQGALGADARDEEHGRQESEGTPQASGPGAAVAGEVADLWGMGICIAPWECRTDAFQASSILPEKHDSPLSRPGMIGTITHLSISISFLILATNCKGRYDFFCNCAMQL